MTRRNPAGPRKALALLVPLGLLLTAAPTAGLTSRITHGAQDPAEPPTAVPAAVVQALFFYSPTCPHCHEVMENVLPPLMARYGGQLQLIGVDVSNRDGQQLYRSAVAALGIPEDRVGVPTLVVGDDVMVGSGEIPARFPGLIEAGLADGGIEWPAIPGLGAALERARMPGTPADTTGGVGAGTARSSDDASGWPVAGSGGSAGPPSGAALAWSVLAGLALALVYTGQRLFRSGWPPRPSGAGLDGGVQRWAVPLLVAAGTGVAAYLAVVETTATAAVCGPIGDCNRVQSSAYATIAGVPVAVLGLAAFLSLGVLWGALKGAGARAGFGRYHAFLALALAGTLFSVYLTALELFVIHAVCLWCLSSAVITALLLVAGASLAEPPTKAVTPERTPGPMTASPAR